MAEKRKKSILRIILSVVAGLAISFLAFICYCTFEFFEGYGELDFLFLMLFNISLILFIVFWNIPKSKLKYFMLVIPVVFFIFAGVLVGIDFYDDYAYSLPRMTEGLKDGGRESSLLFLDEKSTFILKDNFPILDGATAFYPLYGAFMLSVYQPDKYINFFSGENKVINLSKQRARTKNFWKEK